MAENEETISERLAQTKVRNPEDGWVDGNPPWVYEGPPPAPDDIVVRLPSEEAVEVEVGKEGPANVKPRRFLELVESGVPAHLAAKKMGTTVRDLTKSKDLKDRLKKLLETSRLPSTLRKEMVRAGLNQIFMENFDGSPKEQKLAVAAAKEIGGDPEIGLKVTQPTGGVVIDMGQLGRLIQEIKPIPGLEQILEGDALLEEASQ